MDARTPQQDLQAVAGFAQIDDANERLALLIALLRSWSASPTMFDGISPSDRQNLFLLAVSAAEAAQTSLSARR